MPSHPQQRVGNANPWVGCGRGTTGRTHLIKSPLTRLLSNQRGTLFVNEESRIQIEYISTQTCARMNVLTVLNIWGYVCYLAEAPNDPWSIQCRHYERHRVSNYRRLDCLINRMFRWRSKETSNLRVTGLCEGNSPVTGTFPAQRASNAENVSIWWRYHVLAGVCHVSDSEPPG